MSALSLEEQTVDNETNATALMTAAQPADETQLADVLEELQSLVPPLWPLRDYVAVNPFLGLSGKTFLDARQLLCGVRDCDLLMPRNYFQSLLENEEVTRDDVATALQQCRHEYPDPYADLKPDDAIGWIANASTEPESGRTVRTVAEVVDQHSGSTWSSHIMNDISRYVSAHYDEGQAVWQSPWKSLPLYEAWRETAMVSRRMEQLGIIRFRSFASRLPKSPLKAIGEMLELLEIPRFAWRSLLMCEISSVSGWASMSGFEAGIPALRRKLTRISLGCWRSGLLMMWPF